MLRLAILGPITWGLSAISTNILAALGAVIIGRALFYLVETPAYGKVSGRQVQYSLLLPSCIRCNR